MQIFSYKGICYTHLFKVGSNVCMNITGHVATLCVHKHNLNVLNYHHALRQTVLLLKYKAQHTSYTD